MPIARDLLVLLGSAENLAALERLYEDVIRRVLAELAAGVSRPGAARIAATMIRIRQLAREINPAVDSRLRDWIKRELPQAFILGDKNAVDDVRRALEEAAQVNLPGGGPLITGFSPIHQTQLSAILAAMRNTYTGVYRQILQTSEYVLRRTQLALQTDQAVRDHIVSGIVRGAAGRQISNDIARAILRGQVPADAQARLTQVGLAGDIELYKQLADGKLVQVGGRRFNVRTYSNLVARTMQREAATLGTIARLQENGINHIQVSDTLPTDPDVCSLVAGNIYYIGAGEDPLGFPSYRSMPGGGIPLHPNCRHVVRAWVAAYKTEPDRAGSLANVQASQDFWGMEAAAASKRVGELVKAGGIAALQKLNPRLYGQPEAPAKGKAA